MRTPNFGVIPNLSKSFSREVSLEMFRRGSFTRQFEYQVKHAFDQKIIQNPIKKMEISMIYEFEIEETIPA